MDFSKYENKKPYPKYVSKPVLKENSPAAARAYATALENYEKEKDAQLPVLHEYNLEQARLHNLFRKDLFKELGIEKNPKACRAFQLAWERGHSSGYSEVYNEMFDLVELIK